MPDTSDGKQQGTQEPYKEQRERLKIIGVPCLEDRELIKEKEPSSEEGTEPFPDPHHA